jgi:hypothetical protein
MQKSSQQWLEKSGVDGSACAWKFGKDKINSLVGFT